MGVACQQELGSGGRSREMGGSGRKKHNVPQLPAASLLSNQLHEKHITRIQ